jgi:hypothetical protein
MCFVQIARSDARAAPFGGIAVPTNIVAVLERKRQTQAEASAHTTMLLAYLVVSLALILLQLTVPNFAEALVLIGNIEF